MSAKEVSNSSEEFNFPALHAVPNFDNENSQDANSEEEEKVDLMEQENIQLGPLSSPKEKEEEQHDESVNVEDEMNKPFPNKKQTKSKNSTLKKEQSEMEDDNKTKTKHKNKKNPMISKVLRIIRRTFITGFFVAGIGMSYIWADQNGYIAMATNVFHEDEVTSEIDVSQNELISKLQLSISDIKKQISQDAENAMQTNKEQAKLINGMNQKYTQLLNDLENFKKTTAEDIKLVNGNFKLNEQRIQANTNELGIQSEFLKKVTTQEAENKEVSNANSALLNRLQQQTNNLINKVKSYSTKAKANANALAKSNNRKVETQAKKTANKVVPSKTQKPVAKAPEEKIVNYYSGLSIAQTFHWSTQVIAVLSDSMGTNIQITKGDKLGEATVIDVKDSYVSIRDDLTGTVYKLKNGNN